MTQKRAKAGGGWASIRYSLKKAKEAGGILKLYRALKKPNTCKTCAIGMGGKAGGMKNETGDTFQVCKKSIQSQTQDMHSGINENFFPEYSIKDLLKLSGRELEGLGRLTQPLFLPEGGNHFRVLQWTEALEKLLCYWNASIPDRSFFYTSGRSSMEAAFLVQLIARQWGTNNINNCSYYCHQASGVGLTESLGNGTSTVQLEDLKKADLVVLIGANPPSNHPRLMTQLIKLRRGGGKIVVINPLQELGLQNFKLPRNIMSLMFGSKVADFYIQPHCGGDLAFLKSAATYLWQKKIMDMQFLKNNCNNLEEFKKDLASQNLDLLLNKSGVTYNELEEFCTYLKQSKNTIFAWGMGITQHLHGVKTVRTLANLALMLGMVGKPAAGLLPLRGHSNVQGVGTVGVVPKLKPSMAEALFKNLKIKLPEISGKDTFNCMKAADQGEIDFAFMLGGNLFGSNPDQKWASEALAKINFTAFLSTTLNLGHIRGHGKNTLLLPVRARDEEKQNTTQESMFNLVRMSSGGGKPPAKGLLSETDILVYIGKNLFANHPIPWDELSNHNKVREFIARIVPDMHQIANIVTGKEFTIPGRIKHSPHFSTSNGKANLAIIEAFDANPEQGRFNLMTIRSEGQFNTIVYEDEDLYRDVKHRMVVFLCKNDIVLNNLSRGQSVWVESEAGKMLVELVEGPIRKGNVAMYFPEANKIVPRKIDPQSKTPSFKRVPVKIYPA